MNASDCSKSEPLNDHCICNIPSVTPVLEKHCPIYYDLKRSGFTLIELVIGIVVFAGAMVMVTSVIMPQTIKGIEPIWQVRAATLAQSIMDNIKSKPFDESIAQSPTREPCGITGITAPCTESASLGADLSETIDTFDDIDDFHGLTLTGSDIANLGGLTISTNPDVQSSFNGFSAVVSVFYDDNQDGINDDDLDKDGSLDTGAYRGTTKLINVIVITPNGENIPFALYRSNF